MRPPKRKIFLGQTDDGRPIHITTDDLACHLQAIGGSNRGKSSFFEILMRDFIRHGEGFTLVDPHGSLYEKIVAWCAYHGSHKVRKIHLIEPGAEGWRVGIDPIGVPPHAQHSEAFDDYITDGVFAVMDAFAQAWGGEDINKMATYQRYGMKRLHTRWTPLARIDIYDDPTVKGAMLFQDGDAPGIVPGKDYEIPDSEIHGISYLLTDKPRVLIIGIGGGFDIKWDRPLSTPINFDLGRGRRSLVSRPSVELPSAIRRPILTHATG